MTPPKHLYAPHLVFLCSVRFAPMLTSGVPSAGAMILAFLQVLAVWAVGVWLSVRVSRTTIRVDVLEADPADATALTALAHRAKAHWGYSDEWLEIWSGDLTISNEYLTTHRGFVAVADGATVGVCVLAFDGIVHALEHVWIAPEHQRLGVGRALVTRALHTASDAGAVNVSVLSDPFAEAFYLRLGARRTGSVPAPMPGSPERVLPRLEFIL